jgi:hypothetical protein
MAFDPIKTLTTYANTECSVQMWVADAAAVQFGSLGEAVAYAKAQGGKWTDVDITVHMPSEDIAFGSDKTRMLIDAAERLAKQRLASKKTKGGDDGQTLE